MEKNSFLRRELFFVTVILLIFYNPNFSQDITIQQEPSKVSTIPVKCTQVINPVYNVGNIAVDSKGNIFVCRWGTGVEVYNSLGESEFNFPLQDATTIMAGNKEPVVITGIDIDVNDHVYLANTPHSTIEVFTNTGEFVKKIALPISPKKDWYGVKDIVVSEDGTVYVPAHFKFIYIFNQDGSLLERWTKSRSESDLYNVVTGIAIGRYKNHKDKRIYVGDGYAQRVYVYNRDDKKLLFSFGNRGAGPGEMLDIEGIDIDSEGRIYVLDRGLGWCSVFDRDGKFLFRFGHEEGGLKELYFPTSIFIDKNDKIYISNGEKNSIVIWEYEKK